MPVLSRVLLATGTAILATIGLLTALAPAADADGPLTALTVGSNTTGTHPVTLVNKGSISVTMGSISANCSSASGSGYVTASSPAANPYLVITSTTFVGCTGVIGQPMNLIQTCDLEVDYDGTPTVNATLTDLVDGALSVDNCLSVSGYGCSLTVDGSVDADLSEPQTSTSPSVQDLVIKGTGLVVDNVSGCFNSLSNGASINFNLTFDVTSADGAINFAPTILPPPTLGVGSFTSGDHDITVTSTGAINVTMGSISAACTSASGSGYVTASSPAANPYVVITSTTFTGCTGPLGIPVTFTQTCDLVVYYDGTSTVDAALTDVVDGTLVVNNCLSVSGTGCSLKVNGSVDGDFSEPQKSTSPSVQGLVISGTGLTVSNVSGCFGLVSNGASINFNLTFDVTSADGAISFIP